MKYNSNVLKMKTPNQLGLAGTVNISKIFGSLFFSALGPQPDFSNLSILVFPPLQKFEFTLHVRYCCVIRAWSSDFNPSSYLQLWIGSVHQSHAPGASLGEEFIGLSSLGAGDFILRGLIAFKICHAQLWMGYDHWNFTSAKTFAVLQIWWP